jgi:hypothetical protein
MRATIANEQIKVEAFMEISLDFGNTLRERYNHNRYETNQKNFKYYGDLSLTVPCNLAFPRIFVYKYDKGMI